MRPLSGLYTLTSGHSYVVYAASQFVPLYTLDNSCFVLLRYDLLEGFRNIVYGFVVDLENKNKRILPNFEWKVISWDGINFYYVTYRIGNIIQSCFDF